MIARASPPRRPPPSVPSTSPPRDQRNVEVKQEKEEDGNRPRGIVRPRDDESPHSRSVRRRLRVQQEFQNVLPGYIPYIAEYAAQRIGCFLVPKPLTPELPPVSSSETQTSPIPPMTVSSSSTQMTPPPSPPTAGSATSTFYTEHLYLRTTNKQQSIIFNQSHMFVIFNGKVLDHR